jgi:hypothetical protein
MSPHTVLAAASVPRVSRRAGRRADARDAGRRRVPQPALQASLDDLEPLVVQWQRALDAADRALWAAAHTLPAPYVRSRRRALADERRQTAELLITLARAVGGRRPDKAVAELRRDMRSRARVNGAGAAEEAPERPAPGGRRIGRGHEARVWESRTSFVENRRCPGAAVPLASDAIDKGRSHGCPCRHQRLRADRPRRVPSRDRVGRRHRMGRHQRRRRPGDARAPAQGTTPSTAPSAAPSSWARARSSSTGTGSRRRP